MQKVTRFSSSPRQDLSSLTSRGKSSAQKKAEQQREKYLGAGQADGRENSPAPLSFPLQLRPLPELHTDEAVVDGYLLAEVGVGNV